MTFYQIWAHKLFPKVTFQSFIDKAERVCHKREMRVYLDTLQSKFDHEKTHEEDAHDFMFSHGTISVDKMLAMNGINPDNPFGSALERDQGKSGTDVVGAEKKALAVLTGIGDEAPVPPPRELTQDEKDRIHQRRLEAQARLAAKRAAAAALPEDKSRGSDMDLDVHMPDQDDNDIGGSGRHRLQFVDDGFMDDTDVEDIVREVENASTKAHGIAIQSRANRKKNHTATATSFPKPAAQSVTPSTQYNIKLLKTNKKIASTQEDDEDTAELAAMMFGN
ncbi:hypothetical protein SeMB42_g06986 [Synchytrium endobioticum]|uniref:Chromosome segregation in meiosis protein n=1 Tax=Synchytrium endobioticum TaxID=286115 RepID=A0A507CBP1_9FUNG|nr:hypothetical protein SeMB42_g06986 [Synchytrium endobioticum]